MVDDDDDNFTCIRYFVPGSSCLDCCIEKDFKVTLELGGRGCCD